MGWDIEPFKLDQEDNENRLRLIERVFKSSTIEEIKLILENKQNSSLLMQDNLPNDLTGYIRDTAIKILDEEQKERIDTNETNKLLKEVIIQKANETRLFNDLAFLSLNNIDEFIMMCNDTLRNQVNLEKHSYYFVKQLKKLYHLTSNFTNNLISFYLTNREKLEFVQGTKELTVGFKGDTNLHSIKKSKMVNVTDGRVIGTVSEGYLVFSVDFSLSISTVIDYMFNSSPDQNPFKVQLGELEYFRDLRNGFTTFDTFDDSLRNQFIENILNQTNAVLVGLEGNKAYFIGKYTNIKDFKNTFNFKIYGVEFTQKSVLESLGGILID